MSALFGITVSRRIVVSLTFVLALIAGAVGSLPVASAAELKPATTLLASLPVGPEHIGGYRRDLFRLWVDADRNGCDTRREVLIAEAVTGRRSGCGVVDGTWLSTYDGVTTNDPSSFDIDHMVPLKEAWDSGAFRWTPATRQAFANDLDYASSLIAVTASSNRSKADQDPATWQPAQGRCRYAKAWIGVKYRWRLSVDAAEKSALQRMLVGCRLPMAVPSLAATETGS